MSVPYFSRFIHCTDDSPDPSLDYEVGLFVWFLGNLNESLTGRVPFVLGYVPIKFVLFVLIVLLGQCGEVWLSNRGHKVFVELQIRWAKVQTFEASLQFPLMSVRFCQEGQVQ